MQRFSVTGHLSEKRVVMKKLITIVLLSVLAVPVLAQDYDFEPEEKWTVKANAAYFPTVPTIVLPFIAIAMGLATANKDNNEKVEISLPPYASIEGLYSINADWSVGLSAGYFGSTYRIVDQDDKHEVSRSDLIFIPVALEGRLNYLNRPAVKLYGSLEAGVVLSPDSDQKLIPDVQLNPIGVEFGRRFFGMVELGIGMNYTGVRGGIGFRF